MPSQTFFNLPEAKKEKIVEAAFDEFALYSFTNASIARIVANAGIPRGSFYQYFSDLKDLYKYLFHLVGEQKMVYVTETHQQMQQADYLAIIKALYAAGIRFAADHPRFARLGANFYKEDPSFRREIMGEFEDTSLRYFEGLLQSGQEKGDVDKKIDIKVAAYLFHTTHIAVVEYIIQNRGQEYLFAEHDGFLDLADKVLYILANGLNAKDK
ncbi:MAG: TetR/AcrR family transcriptional regulator [Bacillota bacterium]|nr:TetR/AcrR family transcriptional regulator [Bacillota bacterium]MDW7683956.1 TetR/AcrR family transcriptional regulator [Bacillota bacterium]